MSTTTSAEASPSPSPVNANNAPKYGTLVPNRIFVGGISANTTEAELHALFSTYGSVKATKIISDRAGVSKGYGFVTFETEEEAKRIQKEADNIVLKDRKLNIAPAIKKQQPFSRLYDSAQTVQNGTLMYHNGIPYTYQNGMAFFTSPEGSYSFPQPQATYPMVYSQPIYVPQQQYQYQTPAAQPQWTAPANQWRWNPQVTYSQNPNLHATQYIYPHNAATAASTTMSASHGGETFQYAQPAAHAPYQQPAPDLPDIPIMEATPAETFDMARQFYLSLGGATYTTQDNIMEQHRQVLPAASRPASMPESSPTLEYNVISIDQGNKSYKKPNNSPRKVYTPPTGASRMGQQQPHRQKLLPKQVNGIHILSYPSADKSDDLMHSNEGGIHTAAGPLTPPTTPMTPTAVQDVSTASIIECTRKLQQMGM